jgi:hypothetical protein
VPPQDATAANLFEFLEEVSPVSEYDDENVAFYEAYVYQSHAELGYPSEEPSYLEGMGLLQFGDADYAGELPSSDDRDNRDDPDPDEEPDDDGKGKRSRATWRPVEATFDPTAMAGVKDYVAERGDRLLFIYGGNDPWSARRFELGNATRSALFVQPDGTHRAKIGTLLTEDRSAALEMLAAWTGVEPVPPRSWTAGETARDEWSRRRLPASGK